jgi:6,7-dimethyl-8-ribityllumazine synthase
MLQMSADGPRSSAATDAPRIAVVLSRYNTSITDALLEGALAEFERTGARRESVAVFQAPGSFELPALALAAARSGRFDAVVALGCLIKGETRHDRYIAEAVARGLTEASLAAGIPIAFGVLTVDKPGQARARAGGKHGNKGAEAMGAAIAASRALHAIRSGARSWALDGGRTHDKAPARTHARTGGAPAVGRVRRAAGAGKRP